MGELVNLRQARKARARKQAEDMAAANRALFGRTRAEKSRDAQTAEQLARRLDQHQREPCGED